LRSSLQHVAKLVGLQSLDVGGDLPLLADRLGPVGHKFIRMYVRPNNRSAAMVEAIFNRHVRSRLGTRQMREITRRDVVAMLDAIEETAGPVAADRTLAHVRKFFMADWPCAVWCRALTSV
jgi:hypothetical protein